VNSSVWRVRYVLSPFAATTTFSSATQPHTHMRSHSLGCGARVCWRRSAQVLRHRLPAGFEPSELGQLVFGLQPWEGFEATTSSSKSGGKKCLLM
jgi:hypothetical protein